MGSRLVLFIFGLIVWLAFTWPNDVADLVIGVFVALFIAYLAGDMFAENPQVYKSPKRLAWLLAFVFVFIYEYLKASLEIVFKLIRPQVGLKPGIVKVKTELRSETALVFLANAITLSRGTLSVDIASEKGFLYIHWLDVKTQDIDAASKKIAGKFEGILKKVYE